MHITRPVRIPEGPVHEPEVLCVCWMRHTRAGWPHVRPWVLGWPTATKISLSCLFFTQTYFKPPENSLSLYKTFYYDMCDFKHLLAKISLLIYDPACLRLYNLVQNFNLTKHAFP